MTDDDDEKLKELQKRYVTAMHAVQSGVAMAMTLDDNETSPKHLRVGISSAMVTDAGLARLLISKGLITPLEYFEAMATQAEQEKAMYERELTERSGKKVTLA